MVSASPRENSLPEDEGTPVRTARQSRPPAGLTKSRPAKKPGGTLSFAGAKYKLNTELGIWPALQFARAAEAGWRTDDPRGMAAIHAFLQDVLDPEDWPRFQEDMINKKVVDLEGLMAAANQAVNLMLDKQLEAAKEAAKRNGQRKTLTASVEPGEDEE